MANETQVVIVTGGGSGFGRLTSETLARQGHTIFVGVRESAGRNAATVESLRALATREQLELRVVELDVTDDASVERAVEQVIATAGRLDVVVNNAGVAYSGPIEAFTAEQAQRQFDTNVFGVLRMNRAALPQMRAQGSGLLVQVGSVVGRLAFPFLGLYGATKFALEGVTESYRYELAAFGIDAVIVEPGTYPTEIGARSVSSADADRVAPYAPVMGPFVSRFFADLTTTPPDPQEVADAIASLIELPHGERPLRTVVALASQSQPPREVNAVSEQAMRSYLASIGATDLFPSTRGAMTDAPHMTGV